ncbi:MAG: hypothetical protein Tp136SUR676911_28 [Prokaryotic dsDNA virus sp.]|nr:MAG: hypothetical protein Tp136SUR676911_28 [Prokaryotic dsDNA virus sp.]
MKLSMILAVLALTSVVSGCASTSEYCLIAEPHEFSGQTVDAMTDEEVKQELTHNAQYDKLCK